MNIIEQLAHFGGLVKCVATLLVLLSCCLGWGKLTYIFQRFNVYLPPICDGCFVAVPLIYLSSSIIKLNFLHQDMSRVENLPISTRCTPPPMPSTPPAKPHMSGCRRPKSQNTTIVTKSNYFSLNEAVAWK